MVRVYVIVEGPTEESFVKGPLAEALAHKAVYVMPTILGVPGHKGGRPNYDRVQKDILRQLKQDKNAYCSTMFDFYGLGSGFPGTPLSENLNSRQKVEKLETALKEIICGQIPEIRPDIRFIPYLALHEYEALLFSDSDAFARALLQPDLAAKFGKVRNDFDTPEDINDSPQTAPSKRILKIHPAYNKVLNGTQAARAVGVSRMRQECPHFNTWVTQLEALQEI